MVLRLGLAAVMLWFGTEQFLHTDTWTAYVPDSIVSLTGMSVLTLVKINAWFEVIFGVLLVIGWQTRIIALLLALHIFEIMFMLGYGEIAVRDFGLGIAMLAIALRGPDAWCLDGERKQQLTISS